MNIAQRLCLALDAALPGLFSVVPNDNELHDEDQESQDDEWAEIYLMAPSPTGEPGAALHAGVSFGEYSIGIGSLSHTHFDSDQLGRAIALAQELASGKMGSFETIKPDGLASSARMIPFDDLAVTISIHAPKDGTRWRARFFPGVGDLDSLR
jgi:hypothetical protein